MAPMSAYSAPKVTMAKDNVVSKLPAIWQEVPAAKRLQYVRAAELDATRILAERITGLSLDGKTTVKDLAAADDEVKGSLSTMLKGVKTVGSPTFHDDGRVEVIRAVKIKNLVEVISKRLDKPGKTKVALEVVMEELDALGNAAIPDSAGHARVMAKRAAEMDVYRRLAERISGVEITTDTKMKDFVVQNDEIKAGFSNVVKSAEITEISYLDDNSAEVTAKVKLGPLVRVITRTVAASGKVLKTDTKLEQMEIEEKGVGAANASGGTNATAPTTTEIEVIISTTLQ